MADLLFNWISDSDDDGDLSDETTRYETEYWLPNLPEDTDGGRQVLGSVLPVLSGGVKVLSQARAGRADARAPGRWVLKWEIADPVFIALSREDYARRRLVRFRLDHRLRQCEVTGSGLADLKVTVAAGWIDDGGDTYWLAAAAEVTCEPGDAYVYASLADGAATMDSGASVPAGAVELAAISIDGNTVSVAQPSGAANAVTGYIAPGGWKTTQNGPHTGLELTVQEVR